MRVIRSCEKPGSIRAHFFHEAIRFSRDVPSDKREGVRHPGDGMARNGKRKRTRENLWDFIIICTVMAPR